MDIIGLVWRRDLGVISIYVVIETMNRQDCVQNGKRKGQRLTPRTLIFNGMSEKRSGQGLRSVT